MFMLPIGRRGCIWNLLFICLNKEEKHLGTAYTNMEGSERSDRWILKVWCLTFKGILCMMDRAYGL